MPNTCTDANLGQTATFKLCNPCLSIDSALKAKISPILYIGDLSRCPTVELLLALRMIVVSSRSRHYSNPVDGFTVRSGYRSYRYESHLVFYRVSGQFV